MYIYIYTTHISEISVNRIKNKGIQSRWLLSKSLQAINAGEGVEKREPSYTVGGNANWYSHYGKQRGDLLKNWK